MSDIIYSSINTILRIRESELLSRDILDSLLKSKSLDNALQILKSTKYELTDNYNQELMLTLENLYAEIFDLLPNKKIADIFALNYTYHNLKVLLKIKLANLSIDHLLINIGMYSIDELKHLVYTKESQDSILNDAVQQVCEHYGEFEQIESIDILLDRFYFKHLIHIAKTLEINEILTMVNAWVDLFNINCLLRVKSKKSSRSFLMSILSEQGSIPVQELVEIALNKNYDKLFDLLKSQEYFDSVQHILLDNTFDSFQVEYAKDSVAHFYLEKAKFEPFGCLPVLAYLYYSEMEVKNLRLILTGKENGFELSQLQERMRPTYDL